MRAKAVSATAPTRIDLAGGTLDIWPLNLMIPSPVTVNLAIDIMVCAQIKPKRDKKVIIKSIDQKETVKFDSIESIHHRHKLGLLSRIAEYYLTSGGVEIITKSDAPAGAGIAGSSALNIALCHSMAKFTEIKQSNNGLIDIAKDIEAALLGIPTGLQDYGASVYGSGSSFSFTPGGMERQKLPAKSVKWLADNLLLFYSGKSRSSGINNWKMFRQVIEKNKKTIRSFKLISKQANKASDSLMSGDYTAFTRAVNYEWEARQNLFKNISTPRIDKAIAKAFALEAQAARICGAGGGGCFFVIAPRAIQANVINAITKTGCEHLPFKPAIKGIHTIL